MKASLDYMTCLWLTAQKHGFDPEEDFEDVQHELTLELEDLIKGGHDMDEAYSSPPPFKDMYRIRLPTQSRRQDSHTQGRADSRHSRKGWRSQWH